LPTNLGPSVVVSFDATEFRQRARHLNAHEMPKAIQKALWNTAERVRDDERKWAKRTFKKSKRRSRKNFLIRGIRAKGGRYTPQNTAMVYAAGRAAAIFPDHHKGRFLTAAQMKLGGVDQRKRSPASRLKVKDEMAVPTRAIKRNAKGEVDLLRYATEQELKERHFVLVNQNGQRLWAVRTKRKNPLKRAPRKLKRFNTKQSTVIFMFVLKTRTKLKENFPFYRIAHRRAPKHFPKELRRTIARATESKRFGRTFTA